MEDDASRSELQSQIAMEKILHRSMRGVLDTSLLYTDVDGNPYPRLESHVVKESRQLFQTI